MLLFDQLRISDDGKRMYINIHVNFAKEFDNIMLDSITIVTADKVSENHPESPSEDYIYKKVYTEDLQVDNLVLTPVDMNENFMKDTFSQDLFFVYVKCKGTPDPCTPCRLDEEITVGVTFDENILYQHVMDYTKQLADTCQIPVGFADFILLWNAFKAAVETEHFLPAVKYWKMLFGNSGENQLSLTNHKNCGCHG
jgi:hypothetical protein